MNVRARILYSISVFLLAALPALSHTVRKASSSTKGFVIDGKRFLVDFPDTGDSADRDSFYPSDLREISGHFPLPALPLPAGYLPERTIRLESGYGPVDLAFGTSKMIGRFAQDGLSESGWRFFARDELPYDMNIAMKTIGKELSIVFLDKKGGEFLLIRRTE